MRSKNMIFVPAILMVFLVLFFTDDIQSVQKGNTNQKLHYVSQSVYVELLADGSMNSYTISKSINISEKPLHEYTFMSSINTLEKVFDGEGNELEYSVRHEPDVYVFTVQLRKSVKPDEELVIKTVDKNIKTYQRQDGIYMYSKKHIPGPDIQYTEEIKIHPDLQLIAFVPSPSQKLKQNKSTVLAYNYEFKEGEAFFIRVLFKPKNKEDKDLEPLRKLKADKSSTSDYYMAIELNDILCGYSEITLLETEKDGRKINILDQKTFITFSALGKDMAQKQKFTYHIDKKTGNFIYHDSYMEQGGTRRSGAVYVEDDTIRFTSKESKEDMITHLPEKTILPNTQFYPYLLQDFGTNHAAKKTYQIYDVRSGKIQEVTYIKAGEEQLELAGETYNAIILNQSDSYTGGKTKIWIDAATGMRVKTISSNNICTYLTDVSVKERIEIGNWDDIFFIKTNKFIKDIKGISYMKVKAGMKPVPAATQEKLNVAGQHFTGNISSNLIEGVFEIEYKKYDGSKAPPFPWTNIQDESIKKYLNPEETIESDDPALIKKAKKITEGSKDSWEAACRLSSWVVENIDGAVLGGTARETYDRGKGLCGAQSKLLTALCRSVGIPARVVWGCLYTAEYGGSFGHHGWNEIYMGKAGWIPVDVTIGEHDYVDSSHIRIGILQTLQTVINFKKMEILEYRNHERKMKPEL